MIFLYYIPILILSIIIIKMYSFWGVCATVGKNIMKNYLVIYQFVMFGLLLVFFFHIRVFFAGDMTFLKYWIGLKFGYLICFFWVFQGILFLLKWFLLLDWWNQRIFRQRNQTFLVLLWRIFRGCCNHCQGFIFWILKEITGIFGNFVFIAVFFVGLDWHFFLFAGGIVGLLFVDLVLHFTFVFFFLQGGVYPHWSFRIILKYFCLLVLLIHPNYQYLYHNLNYYYYCYGCCWIFWWIFWGILIHF